MAFDAGHHRPAQDHSVLGAHLAKSGGDLVFGAVVLSALARLQFDIGAAADGLNVVRMAQRGSRRIASPRLASMLATREAWGTPRTVASADFAPRSISHSCPTVLPAEFPAVAARFDAAELHGTVGARFRDMARYDRQYAGDAAAHVRIALELREPERVRNRAFDPVSLARVQLIAGEPDGSADSMRAALPHVDVHRPRRLGRKPSDWIRESEPYRTVPAVADVRDRIRQSVSSVGTDGVTCPGSE